MLSGMQAVRKKDALNESSGFTLIEIIVVIFLLGLLASIAAAKALNMDESASQKALTIAVSGLNERERHTWMEIKLSGGNWSDDDVVFAAMDTDLGPGYRWSSKTAGGGTLHFSGQTAVLKRTPSTSTRQGIWNPF